MKTKTVKYILWEGKTYKLPKTIELSEEECCKPIQQIAIAILLKLFCEEVSNVEAFID